MNETHPATARLKFKTVLAICRVSNLPTVWMNVLAATVLARAGDAPDAGSPIPSILLLSLSLSAFYCGGMCLNDIFDRDWDADHQPFRPIPSGLIEVAKAWQIASLLFALGLGLLLLAPYPSAIIAGLALLLLIFFYDRYHKQFSAAVVVMASTRVMVFVVTAWGVAASLNAMVMGAALVQFIYTLLVSAVARHENSRGAPYAFPVIPRMLAAMAIVDGLVVSAFLGPIWLVPGILFALATHFAQRFVRGD